MTEMKMSCSVKLASLILYLCLVCSPFSDGCMSMDRMSRMLRRIDRGFNILTSAKPRTKFVRLNAPGQRFTATHGITMRAGEKKTFLFVVDRSDANYMAVSANIAVKGEQGGPDKYDLYVRFGRPPTPQVYDYKSTVTASESYVGEVLYSRDVTIPRPKEGPYYLLLVARESFHELLVTAILDTPPDLSEAGFTIRRIGEVAK